LSRVENGDGECGRATTSSRGHESPRASLPVFTPGSRRGALLFATLCAGGYPGVAKSRAGELPSPEEAGFFTALREKVYLKTRGERVESLQVYRDRLEAARESLRALEVALGRELESCGVALDLDADASMASPDAVGTFPTGGFPYSQAADLEGGSFGAEACPLNGALRTQLQAALDGPLRGLYEDASSAQYYSKAYLDTPGAYGPMADKLELLENLLNTELVFTGEDVPGAALRNAFVMLRDAGGLARRQDRRVGAATLLFNVRDVAFHLDEFLALLPTADQVGSGPGARPAAGVYWE